MPTSAFDTIMTQTGVPALLRVLGVPATHTNSDGDDVAVTVILKTGTVAVGDFGERLEYQTTLQLASSAGARVGDVFTLAAPGIRIAQGSGDRLITLIATGPRNVAFSRNAILLATRLPMVPAGGDMAIDTQTVVDPRSGMVFEIAVYPGFLMNTYHVRAAWGVSVLKPEHVAVLLG